jgi:predicted acetyltransferase
MSMVMSFLSMVVVQSPAKIIRALIRMEVILQKVKESEKNIVQNLAAFYTYDMSRYCGNLPGWETPNDGTFSCFDLSKYWTELNRYPYFIKVDNELAGFALIHKVGTAKDIDWTVGEFFVVAKFQGKGVGREVARKLFTQFPGKWEVMQIPENTAAIHFWEKVISEYTKGDYSKSNKIVQEPKPHPMVVMTFLSISHHSFSNHIVIKQSNVRQFEDGLGCFAAKDFEKGEIVISWNLKTLSEREYNALPEYEKHNFTHLRNGIRYLYPIPERYVNRSSEPNVYPDFESQANIALRDIKTGEELLIAADTVEDF